MPTGAIVALSIIGALLAVAAFFALRCARSERRKADRSAGTGASSSAAREPSRPSSRRHSPSSRASGTAASDQTSQAPFLVDDGTGAIGAAAGGVIGAGMLIAALVGLIVS